MLFPMKTLIGIAGKTASGKTSLAQAIIEHFDAGTNRFSAVLATFTTTIGLGTDKKTLQEVSTALRKTFGENILAHGMATWVLEETSEYVVVEGIRRIADVRLLREAAEESDRKFILIFVDAPKETRFARYNERMKREGLSEVTTEEFHTLETREAEQELPLVAQEADCTIVNDGKTVPEAFEEAMVCLK